jgi:cyclic pyranopterin phosphate synthase
MPADGISKKDHQDILRIEDYLKLIREMVGLGVDKVRLTGGEPLVRRGVLDLVNGIASMEGIKDLSITTNGVLLKKYAEDLKKAGLNRVNISIDTLKPDKYKEITRGGDLADVLAGIEEARRVGLLPIKLNVVLINGFNTDEVEDFIRLADHDMDVRFIELMPIGQVATWTKDKFISNEEIFNRHRHLFVTEPEEQYGPAKYYEKKDGHGRVGFINPISNHFCATCNRVRMTADGKLKLCLHTNEEFDLKPLLSMGDEEIQETLKSYIEKKPERHHMNDEGYQPIIRDMNRIGG